MLYYKCEYCGHGWICWFRIILQKRHLTAMYVLGSSRPRWWYDVATLLNDILHFTTTCPLYLPYHIARRCYVRLLPSKLCITRLFLSTVDTIFLKWRSDRHIFILINYADSKYVRHFIGGKGVIFELYIWSIDSLLLKFQYEMCSSRTWTNYFLFDSWCGLFVWCTRLQGHRLPSWFSCLE